MFGGMKVLLLLLKVSLRKWEIGNKIEREKKRENEFFRSKSECILVFVIF